MLVPFFCEIIFRVSSMKKLLTDIIIIFIVTILAFIIVNKYARFEDFERTTRYEDINVNIDNETFNIRRNKQFEGYNTSERKEKIEYIVIHYTGTQSEVTKIIDGYTFKNVKDASADYFISHDGKIYQYNTEIDKRFSWAVGGEKLDDTLGGSLNGIATNENSISIEMATKYINDEWIFNDETIESSILLTKYLMKKYDVDVGHVIRHYDVTGKKCPGVYGWIEDSDSINEWENFLSLLQ